MPRKRQAHQPPDPLAGEVDKLETLLKQVACQQQHLVTWLPKQGTPEQARAYFRMMRKWPGAEMAMGAGTWRKLCGGQIELQPGDEALVAEMQSRMPPALYQPWAKSLKDLAAVPEAVWTAYAARLQRATT